MFIFKGIDSDSMGVYQTDNFPLPIASPRLEEITIPGRHGTLTLYDGGYQGSEITSNVVIKCDEEPLYMDEISQWLSGIGKLELEGLDDRYFIARVSNILSVDQFLRNDVYKFPLTFKCQPFGYLNTGTRPIVFSSGNTLRNQGNFESTPLIVAHGTGEGTITINDTVITLSNIDGYVNIDSETLECYKGDTNLGQNMVGDYPILKTGVNTITFDGGITSISVTPRWRCL